MPPYDAVIECDPPPSELVVNFALPLFSFPVPKVVVPSRKVTDPVGFVPEPVRTAVKVTELPKADGLRFDAMLTTGVVLVVEDMV